MNTRIPIVAVMLTCAVCAAPATAQSPSGASERVRSAPQERQAAQRAQAAQRRGEAAGELTESFSYTRRLMPGGTFDLRNGSGDVTINGGGNGREVRIEGMKRVRNVANARAQAMLNAIQIMVAERGGNVEVRTMPPRGFARNTPPNRPTAIVDYTIVLPENANVVLHTTSGDLRLQNVSGDQFELNTLSGDVSMQALRGRVLDVHTVTGNMVLQQIFAERALLQSTAGNIEYVGELLRTGRYRFSTHKKGNIRVAPTGTPGFDLDAMTHMGVLRSDFALKRLTQPARGVPGVWRGTVGDAGAALTVYTFGGNIILIKP